MLVEKEFIQFRIRGYMPETLPMARLAEYLAELALLYGARESVRFDRLLRGSAVVQVWIPGTESEAVVRRIRSAKTVEAPPEVRRAYQRIDEMLRENHATADIRRKNGAEIIAFPGAKIPPVQPIEVTDFAKMDGVVVRVGGTDKTIPVHLQAANGDLYPCHVRDKQLAREFAKLLYGEPVRVRGKGQFERGTDGRWKLKALVIDAWEPVDNAPVVEVMKGLRSIEGLGWKLIDDVEAETHRIREGE